MRLVVGQWLVAVGYVDAIAARCVGCALAYYLCIVLYSGIYEYLVATHRRVVVEVDVGSVLALGYEIYVVVIVDDS